MSLRQSDLKADSVQFIMWIIFHIVARTWLFACPRRSSSCSEHLKENCYRALNTPQRITVEINLTEIKKWSYNHSFRNMYLDDQHIRSLIWLLWQALEMKEGHREISVHFITLQVNIVTKHFFSDHIETCILLSSIYLSLYLYR